MAGVYIKCLTSDGRVFRTLHDQWYRRELVSVKYLREERYHERFPGARYQVSAGQNAKGKFSAEAFSFCDRERCQLFYLNTAASHTVSFKCVKVIENVSVDFCQRRKCRRWTSACPRSWWRRPPRREVAGGGACATSAAAPRASARDHPFKSRRESSSCSTRTRTRGESGWKFNEIFMTQNGAPISARKPA